MGTNIFLFLHYQGCNPTTPIRNLPSGRGLRSVSASNIINVIRAETQQVGASRLGFSPEDVGTHSLHSGGTMVMHIANFPDRTLMAIDRWRSLWFMVYIQHQILSFSSGVSVKMIQQPWFWHLWAPCHPPRQAHTHIHTSPHPGLFGWTEWCAFSYCLTKPPYDCLRTSIS